ncbi:aldose 1-epimerase [Monoraphidium neglectum]|uniref:glucose-6-phosphate 1-epimerase n=1 Tax=Monoraphidium neglectum TaxID=145388 RepID=A0A0D2N5G5_9CHLO|nr:aldose 1-epimerase [Monoraphidium neglectum]KIZ07527.1 aldose 1-epimerase [Monoraphidium neglectum]|eukprot:XP_013906546.1 aldose 1-epimerase [Monoraphidium neglectum]
MANVVKDDGNGLDKVVLKTPNGASAEVYRHGAHLTSFKTASGKDVLFVSKQAVFKPPKAIRGGVPVCFPQFGQLGPLGQHGFARNAAFEVVGSGDNSVTLELAASGKEDERYPHPFQLRVTVTLADESLTQKLTAINTGSSPIAFTCALHTYFTASAIDKVRVEGLDGVGFTDSLQGGKPLTQEGPVVFDQEVDRVYIGTPGSIKIFDDGAGSCVEIVKEGFPDAVVWNPWVEKSKAMGDFGDDEYQVMLCIEPAVAGSGAVTLQPGKTWNGTQTLTLSNV